jgi:hypothetical protein
MLLSLYALRKQKWIYYPRATNTLQKSHLSVLIGFFGLAIFRPFAVNCFWRNTEG